MKENYTRRYAHDFNWKKHLFQVLSIFCIAIPFLWLFYKIEVRGKKNIPQGKDYIISPNHISYFDPFIAAIGVRMPIAFMAKKELFENKKLARTVDNLGAFAVNRKKLEVSTIKTARDIFKTKNWTLGIFPEGGIRKNRTIDRINKGFAALAKSAKKDILPVAITGCEEYNWIPFKGKVIIEIGEIISHDQEINEIIDEWGAKVAKMANYKYITVAEEERELVRS